MYIVNGVESKWGIWSAFFWFSSMTLCVTAWSSFPYIWAHDSAPITAADPPSPSSHLPAISDPSTTPLEPMFIFVCEHYPPPNSLVRYRRQCGTTFRKQNQMFFFSGSKLSLPQKCQRGHDRGWRIMRPVVFRIVPHIPAYSLFPASLRIFLHFFPHVFFPKIERTFVQYRKVCAFNLVEFGSIWLTQKLAAANKWN